MFRSALPLFGCALLASCGGLRGCGQESVEPGADVAPVEISRPNVLILLWDTVRADRMSLYGHDRPTTPRLDAFAADARVYERATSPGMWTVPSHGSLFTGLDVASHGANAKWIWLDGRFLTLAEHLGASGYETWAWSANPYLSESSNLLQGFETVHLAWDGGWAEAAGKHTMGKRIDRDASVELGPAWPEDKGKGWPAHLVAYKDAAPVAADALFDWLDHRDEGPWLAYVNLLEAHHPRLPSQASRDRVLDPALVEAGLTTDASLFRIMAAMEGHGSFTDEELAAIRGVYDATLADLDTATGDLLDGLAKRGVLDDTVVVVLSDHGEHLGEHGMYDHRWSVYEELLHVPLVVRHPSVEAGRVQAPVSTQQLFPTICAVTGVDCPDLPVDSLLGSPPERVHAELVQPTPRLPPIRKSGLPLDPNRWRRRYQVTVEGDWKLIRASDRDHALYDLGTDPHEADNRWAAETERGAALLEQTRAWKEGQRAYDPADRAPEDHPKPALAAGEGTDEQLRLLGYTEGEPAPEAVPE